MKNQRHHSKTRIAGLGIAGLFLVFLTVSCAGSRYVAINHRQYEKMPHNASSFFWRAFAKSNPYSAKRAFYKRRGGPGNEGGKPVDLMDEGFHRHDMVYYESRHPEHLKAADRCLVKWLENIDPDTLDAEGREFRERALEFMKSPVADFVGKPVAVMFRNEERPGCYFQSVADVEAYFDPGHSGFPYPETPKPAMLASQPEPEEPEPVLIAAETPGIPAASLTGSEISENP